jgi:hypothetical protein
MLKHPLLMHYNRLIAGVVAVNLGVLVYGLTAGGWWSGHLVALGAIALTAQANFAIAIVIRQQHVVNALCRLATRAPTTWPLRIRWMLAKVYHLGGLHVGAAVSGTLWYLAFLGALLTDATRHVGNVSAANVVVSCLLVTLFLVMVVMAAPPLRARAHDRFEVTHRFCGWTAVVLVWVNTVLFVRSQGGHLLTAPAFWMLLLTTASAMLPWMLLRKVPVAVERPSKHVALVGLDHGQTPFIGSVRPISRHPLVGWHTFANIPEADRSPGRYRMAVSRAGDWTSEFIDNPPERVWVRGVPTAGMANVRKLFKKVVYVATGSGIGPMLAHLLADEVPSHLIWVTRSPRATYGDALVDEIMAVQPDATIWNSDRHGKPDVFRLAHDAYVASGAEAVICIANKKVTWQVVHGMERLGVPAFGPIWDS